MAESHVVTALRSKRAELAGEINAVEKHVAQLRANLVHLDATLRLFDPSADPEMIPNKRPYHRRRWFSDGELPRRILDTLRTSPDPLSANDLAERIIAQKGFAEGDAQTLLTIRKSVQSYLRHQTGKLVRQAGRNGRDGLWRVL
jgi:hypothetical protein